MKMPSLLVLTVLFVGLFSSGLTSSANVDAGRYEPNWPSIDKRPTPSWYDEAKFGIFLHWGVFSVPSFGSEWFWNYWHTKKYPKFAEFMKKNYRPGFTYADFAPQFTAEFYDAATWAELFKASGAKYLVLTSKHHEGFTNWPSNVSFNWNSMDVGPKRDLVGELATAVRAKTDLHFGLYHSLYEWFNPLFHLDQRNKYKTQLFSGGKSIPELYELVERYKPDVIWSDGHDGAPPAYWNATQFIAWLYNDSPVKDTVVVNDRWGAGVMCEHGDFYTCHDRYQPGKLLKHKWENCMTIDKRSWGFRREASLHDYLNIEDLVAILVETVSCGGNLLMNVGPTHDGRIVPIFEERLRQMGSWLSVNGEAIYSSKPWQCQNDTVAQHLWYTSKKTPSGTAVYAMVLRWPDTDVLTLGCPTTRPTTKVTLLGYSGELKWISGPKGGIQIKVPVIPFHKMPCMWAWVFKMEGLDD